MSTCVHIPIDTLDVCVSPLGTLHAIQVRSAGTGHVPYRFRSFPAYKQQIKCPDISKPTPDLCAWNPSMGTSTLQPCSTYSYSWMNIRTFWSGTRVSCKNMATAPLTDQTPSDFMIFAVAVPTSTWDEMRASRVSLLEQNQVDFLILIQHKSPRCCWNILEQIVNDRCKMRKAIGKHNLTA